VDTSKDRLLFGREIRHITAISQGEHAECKDSLVAGVLALSTSMVSLPVVRTVECYHVSQFRQEPNGSPDLPNN